MNGPSGKRDEKRLSGLLVTAVESIETGTDFAPLVERALGSAIDTFFDIDSPIGVVYVAVGHAGVRHVAPAASAEEFARGYRGRFGRLLVEAPEDEAEDLQTRTAAALAGERTRVPLDLQDTTPFQQRVLETVRGIPHGEVRPYVWVARGRGAGRFQGGRQRDGEQPRSSPGAVPSGRSKRWL